MEGVYDGHQRLVDVEASLLNYNRAIVERITDLCDPSLQTADFGAGIGTLAVLLRDRNITPLCVEIDPLQRNVLSSRGFNTTDDLSSVPDDTLDLIYSSNVIEHIDDDDKALSELHAKLKSGGVLFLYVPAMMTLYSAMDEAVGHRRRYVKSSLARKVADARFEISDIYYADVSGFFITLLFKLLGNKSEPPSLTSLRIYDRSIFVLSNFVEKHVRFPFGKNLVCIARKLD